MVENTYLMNSKTSTTEKEFKENSAPHNPQQNGVVERKNRMIVRATRAMLHDQGLPMHL
jgi:hypothetical protein